jgi:rod shape-determining protein MreC
MAVEANTRLLEPLRQALATVVAPVYFLTELPYLAGGELGELLRTREALIEQTREQEARLTELSHIAQQYRALKTENERLRTLLGSRARLPVRILVAQLTGVVPDPGTHQIILDKGSQHGVHVGAPVIDAWGLFGQVVEVGLYSSRLLLVTDSNHAVPVQINRNGFRSIAGGTGDREYLELEHVPITADITVGDIVETSGLGGGFPPGYPVGQVDSVRIEPTSAFAQVRVRAMADLERSRHLLVILDEADDEAQRTAQAPPDPGVTEPQP